MTLGTNQEYKNGEEGHKGNQTKYFRVSSNRCSELAYACANMKLKEIMMRRESGRKATSCDDLCLICAQM